MPHCDDEFFIYPLLRSLSYSETIFVYLTSGSIYKDGLSQIRMNESTKFLLAQGFSAENILFLGEQLEIEDGQLWKNLSGALEELERVIEKHKPDNLVSVAYEGGHHDHDACFALGFILSKKLGLNIYDYSTYNAFDTKFFRVMNNQGIQTCKYEGKYTFDLKLKDSLLWLNCIFYYRSQWKTFIGLLPGVLNNLLVKKRLVIGKVTDFDPSVKPHANKLFYEKRFKVDYEAIKNEITFLLKKNI